MTSITTIGINLEKNVFHVYGVDEMGKTALNRKLSRGNLLEFFALYILTSILILIHSTFYNP